MARLAHSRGGRGHALRQQRRHEDGRSRHRAARDRLSSDVRYELGGLTPQLFEHGFTVVVTPVRRPRVPNLRPPLGHASRAEPEPVGLWRVHLRGGLRPSRIRRHVHAGTAGVADAPVRSGRLRVRVVRSLLRRRYRVDIEGDLGLRWATATPPRNARKSAEQMAASIESDIASMPLRALRHKFTGHAR